MTLCRRFLATGASLAVLIATAAGLPSSAQTAVPSQPSQSASRPAAETGVRWQQLTPAQRNSLKPLERDWSSIDAARKEKWLELSSRVPSMTADERTRIQTRMADWAKLTPLERGRARLNFEEAKHVPSKDRQARWQDYQALSPDEKRQLAARAAPQESPHRTLAAASAPTDRTDNTERGRQQSQVKSNIVPNPAAAARPRPVAPTVMQAQPGATTTLISKRPAPPAHQQTGLPKIAATPEFVDRATLLPQQGPQGIASKPGAAAASAAGPRR